MLKVLHLLDSVNRGGAEMQVLDVCRNASRFDIEVTFVAAGGGTLEDEFRESGVEFTRLDRMLPIDIRLASRLRQIVKERDIQIVHGYQAVEGLHLYLATRGLKNVRRVLSFQGFIPGKKNQIAARLIASKMDANISVSKSLLDYLRNDVRIKRLDNFHIIYNGADPERLRPSGRSIKEELGLSDDAMLGAMVANFTKDPTKDQLTICHALPAVIEQFPNFHFLFAGRISAGAEEKMFKCRDVCDAAGISANVHFLGPRLDVADLLSELDIFVFSSRREGFPVAVSEAMLAGVPVIASDIEPMQEALRNGELGDMFAVGDEEGLSEKIVQLLADGPNRTKVSESAQVYARDNFSIDAHLRGLKDLYLSITGV